MITVEHAPAYLAVQDAGWPDLRGSGMPVSGAMDRWAMSAANLMLGNQPDAAVLEWALTGGRLRFDRHASYAIVGPGVQVVGTALAGGEVELPRPDGRFNYLAVAGGIDVPRVLGSRSTYVPAALGHRVRTGDRIAIGPAPALTRGKRGFGPAPAYEAGIVKVIAGPQRSLFPEAEWKRLLESVWSVSRTSDRMGYRLEGATGLAAPAADLPSEPACIGAVQVPPDGQPIVLMADGPTVGGYPKIAVVITVDLPILAQRQPGEVVRFKETTVGEAQEALRLEQRP